MNRSEVCKKFGVTRKTLRGYDKIGLLHPTKTTDTGYWLYDDEALKKLQFIQIAVEVGYERKKIKELLDNPDVDWDLELNTLQNLLEGKRNRITGIIREVQNLRTVTALPHHVLDALSNTNLDALTHGLPLSKYLNEEITQNAALNEAESELVQFVLPLKLELFAIAGLKKEDIRSPKVQQCIASFYHTFLDLCRKSGNLEEWKDDISNLTAEEYDEKITTTFLEILDEKELIDHLETYYGDGASEFVRNVFQIYHFPKPTKFKEGKGYG